LGVVAQPRFIPGLSLSVDYYDIKVDGVIVSLTAQAIVNACYDQPTLANPFCDLFSRWRGPGTGPGNENPGDIRENSLISAPLNFAKRIRRGIDTQLAYRANLGGDTRLTTNLIYTHNLKISDYQNPTDPNFENRIMGELGDPVDEFRWDTDIGHGPFTFGYQVRYIGPMWVTAYENFNSLQGRPPQNLDSAEPRKTPAIFYHAIRFEWDISGDTGIGRDLMFYAGVDNVLNTAPPYGLAGTGNISSDRTAGGAAVYDIRGRQFYAGFRARF
jgi:hypothetical protein